MLAARRLLQSTVQSEERRAGWDRGAKDSKTNSPAARDAPITYSIDHLASVIESLQMFPETEVS